MISDNKKFGPEDPQFWYATIETCIKATEKDDYLQLSLVDYLATKFVQAYKLGLINGNHI